MHQNFYAFNSILVLALGSRNIGEELYDDYDLDDEDDDDDDDFIDDSEANVDTSKYIRNIFGYDRRK